MRDPTGLLRNPLTYKVAQVILDDGRDAVPRTAIRSQLSPGHPLGANSDPGLRAARRLAGKPGSRSSPGNSVTHYMKKSLRALEASGWLRREQDTIVVLDRARLESYLRAAAARVVRPVFKDGPLAGVDDAGYGWCRAADPPPVINWDGPDEAAPENMARYVYALAGGNTYRLHAFVPLGPAVTT